MRIAYLVNQYPKVSHSFIRREIRAMEKLGFSITRISLRGWDDELVDKDDFQERELTRYVLREGLIPLLTLTLTSLLKHPIKFWHALRLVLTMSRRSDRPLPVHIVYLAEACRVLDWLHRESIGHLHAHFGTNSAEVAMLVHVLGGPRWSFTIHGPEEFDRATAIGLAEKIRRAEFVVAVSSYGRSQLYRLVDHALWSKVDIVHCGLDSDFLSAASAPSRARRLVCVGRLCAQKGQLLLIEAVRDLATEGMDFELVLAGDGELRGDIEALIADYKLSNRVRVTGWISGEHVREEILAAQALVLPSFAEGLPIVLMEAMALRRPVISTYIAGIPELVVPGDHGWLVPAGDVGALAQAIRACLETPPDLLRRMGEAAHHRVVVQHDADKEVDKLAKLLLSRAPA